MLHDLPEWDHVSNENELANEEVFLSVFFQEKPKESLQYKVSSSLVPVGLVLRDSVHSFLVHTRSSYVSQSLFLHYLLSLLGSSNNRMTNIIKAL